MPALSTVQPPLNEIGRRCAGIILQQIKHHKTGKRRVYLPCTILERNSAGVRRK
jgi:DNA-binding LacI/PurR family transcriptional regulator